jgi:hypothetical protein
VHNDAIEFAALQPCSLALVASANLQKHKSKRVQEGFRRRGGRRGGQLHAGGSFQAKPFCHCCNCCLLALLTIVFGIAISMVAQSPAPVNVKYSQLLIDGKWVDAVSGTFCWYIGSYQ